MLISLEKSTVLSAVSSVSTVNAPVLTLSLLHSVTGYTSSSLSRVPQGSPRLPPGRQQYPSGSDSLRVGRGGRDTRPMEEYDQPWDQRQTAASSLLMSRNGQLA